MAINSQQSDFIRHYLDPASPTKGQIVPSMRAATYLGSDDQLYRTARKVFDSAEFAEAVRLTAAAVAPAKLAIVPDAASSIGTLAAFELAQLRAMTPLPGTDAGGPTQPWGAMVDHLRPGQPTAPGNPPAGHPQTSDPPDAPYQQNPVIEQNRNHDVADPDEVLAFFSSVMRGDDEFVVATVGERLKAGEQLGKAQGLFIQRSEVVSADVTDKYAALTPAQRQLRIANLRKMLLTEKEADEEAE